MINQKILDECKSNEQYSVLVHDISNSSKSCNQEELIISFYKIKFPTTYDNDDIISLKLSKRKVLDALQNTDIPLTAEQKTQLQEEIYAEINKIPRLRSASQFREVTITSDVVLDDNGLMETKFNGIITKKEAPTNTQQLENPSSHYVELIRTNLRKEINIDFEKEYIDMPAITVNIDKENESLYRDFSTKYIKSNEKYIGANITFNYLKSKRVYPTINILIIGDIK